MKDPLLWLSCLLAALGALQTSTSLLSALAQRFPISFGLVMTGISVSTAVLTLVRNAEAARLAAEHEAVKNAAAIFRAAEAARIEQDAKAARLEGDGTGHDA